MRSSRVISASFLAFYSLIFLTVSLIHRIPVTGYETDGVDFMLRARSLSAGSFIPPSYGTTSTATYALWLVNKMIPDVFQAAKILAGLSGAILLFATLKIARAFSEGTALLTGILLLASPWFLFYSNSCLADMLAAAVVTLLFVQKENMLRGSVLAGLAWGIRPVTIVFLPLLLPSILKSPADRLRRTGMAVVGFIAGALPQIIASWRYYGDPLYSENWRNIALLVRPPMQVDRMHRLLELPSADLMRIASIWVKRVFADTPEQTIHVIYWAAAFVIPGIVILWTKYSDRRIWIVTSILYIAVIQLTWRVELRYFLPVLPIFLVAAACGLEQICGSRRGFYNAAAAFLVVTTAAAGISGTTRLLRLQSPELKQAGVYVKQESQDSPGNVLAESVQSIFYSERPGELLEGLAPEDGDNLAATIKARNVRWIIADNRLEEKVPALSWLNDEALTHSRFPDWKATRFGGDLNVLVWKLP